MRKNLLSFRIHIHPKTYEEIPIYQKFIDELETDMIRIEANLPLINEEVALLLRYEIEIDSQVCFVIEFFRIEFK